MGDLEGGVHGGHRGISFPPRLDGTGRWAMSEGIENIRESLRVILLTDPVSRPRVPDFGAGLGRFVNEPNTSSTRRLIQEAITRAVQGWESRVALRGVTVAPDAQDPSGAIATIRFAVIDPGTNPAPVQTLSVRLHLGQEGGA